MSEGDDKNIRILTSITLSVLTPVEEDTVAKIVAALNPIIETIGILGYTFHYYPPLIEEE